VFEPYPMRDTVQHFCEKHLDKIKSYMEKVSVRIPPPAKCTIEGKLLMIVHLSVYLKYSANRCDLCYHHPLIVSFSLLLKKMCLWYVSVSSPPKKF
jgi:hypothetical protein